MHLELRLNTGLLDVDKRRHGIKYRTVFLNSCWLTRLRVMSHHRESYQSISTLLQCAIFARSLTVFIAAVRRPHSSNNTFTE